MIRPNLEMRDANYFLFATVAILHPDLREGLYDTVQRARRRGEAEEMVKLIMNFLRDHQQLEGI